MDKLLRRKIDAFLLGWKSNPERKPLIVKGARQIGKTRSIEWFAKNNYASVVLVNFVEQPKFKAFILSPIFWPFSSKDLSQTG